MSTLREEGVMDVKQTACDQLLASRVEQKLQARRPRARWPRPRKWRGRPHGLV
jgi:hypothetical protein